MRAGLVPNVLATGLLALLRERVDVRLRRARGVPMSRDRTICKRCGKSVAVSARNRMVAHQCPHGAACVLAYAKRRHTKVARCPECFRAAQVALPGFES